MIKFLVILFSCLQWYQCWSSLLSTAKYLSDEISPEVLATKTTVPLTIKYDLEVFYGAAPSTFIDSVCVPNSITREPCEELLCNAFSNLYGIAYFPVTPLVEPTSTREYRTTRYIVLRLIMDKFQYSNSYLEIGTFEDEVFRQMRGLFQIAVGVDPVSGGSYRMTSDEFFRGNSQYFELIFVDGLHEANQVYRDVMNALHWLAPGGTVVMHDCNPLGKLDVKATYPQDPRSINGIWNGDTWKAVVALRLLPDIDLVVVDVDHGVGVIRKRPNSRPLDGLWEELLGSMPIEKLNNEHLRQSREELIPLVSTHEMLDWLSRP